MGYTRHDGKHIIEISLIYFSPKLYDFSHKESILQMQKLGHIT